MISTQGRFSRGRRTYRQLWAMSACSVYDTYTIRVILVFIFRAPRACFISPLLYENPASAMFLVPVVFSCLRAEQLQDEIITDTIPRVLLPWISSGLDIVDEIKRFAALLRVSSVHATPTHVKVALNDHDTYHGISPHALTHSTPPGTPAQRLTKPYIVLLYERPVQIS